jgi:hypothetical protein
MQALRLAPPSDSPFTHTLCLDGVRKLIQMQKAGQWPPPQPQLPLQQQTVFGMQYATSTSQALPQQLSHMTSKALPLLQVRVRDAPLCE